MILDNIVEKKKMRLKELNLDIKLLKEKAENTRSRSSFINALKKEGLSIIGEVKRASPSKGLIKENFDPLELAVEYEECVDAVSVLTEESFFLGSPEYLKKITLEVEIPALRKDFIVDEVQIYEAKILGASAILLITVILDEKILKKFIKTAESLGMDALVEVHTKEEVETALRAGAEIIGINNRNLKTFEVDLNTTIELAKLIPKDRVIVSESGIKDELDIKRLIAAEIDGVLIGEVFMRCDDIGGLVGKFKDTARGKI
ncbi:indole-3-glycerol phosphate synthase TrpC [Psychrilyobacter atlanticus]|uniref:indole-3-glycerol phosphate synthase TrpC n=1 Tax=Psychrilyobacter atlanticus TaxID=271091 RepID=UPI000402BAA5|nr:indole-3-glycerol phosphate synthase TrpC [Psychrilyobacter atlanticus]